MDEFALDKRDNISKRYPFVRVHFFFLSDTLRDERGAAQRSANPAFRPREAHQSINQSIKCP